MKSQQGRKFGGVLLVAALSALVLTGVIVGCRGNLENVFLDAGDFLTSGRTLSFFAAVQVDPQSEDSAGPQFVAAGDLNGDGLTDMVSAWNQSQPVQVHLQGRTNTGGITFETVILAGNVPVVSVAGLAIADFDLDGNPDIAVLVKESGLGGATCLDSEVPETGLSGAVITYLGPVDSDQANQALAWQEVVIGQSRLQGRGDSDSGPELGGFTSMSVGDTDADGDMDIVVAWNTACEDANNALAIVFTNPGPTQVRDGTWTTTEIPDSVDRGGSIKDVALADIDRDGDLDVVATFPSARSLNVRWYRNPATDVPDDYHISDGTWQTGTIGQLASSGDIVRLGDIDVDGVVDVLVRSTNGAVIQWFKGPDTPTTAPVRNVPWQVYTLAEFTDRVPESMAIGDLNNDGQPEVVVSAQGGLAWFDSRRADSVYDQWIENLIIDDSPAQGASSGPVTTDPNVDPQEIVGFTSMQSLVIVDLDGDGTNDILVTLDRAGLSGLTNDALVWFRNTLR